MPGTLRKQVRKGGFRTQAEAARALTEFLHESDQGTAVPNSRITVEEYLKGWLEGLPARGLRPRTIETYESLIRCHVVPTLGPVKVQALTALHLDRLYARLRTEGGVLEAGKPLSARTVRIVHTILRRALADAERQGIVPRNMADLASPPSNKSAKAPEAEIWTTEELRGFLAQIGDHQLHPLVYLAGYTGMRRGELCGLRWSDVDFDTDRISVRQQAQNMKGEIIFSELKTDNARRSIALDGQTVAVLRSHRKTQAEWRLAVGPGWQDSGLVFTQVDGSPFDPSAITKTFHTLVERSGLPGVTLHGLRHSHAAHLLMAGVPALTVSKRLGHSSVIFTQDRYGHLLPDSQDAVVAAIERGR
ncbi:MAG: site-specific integrase [Actinomycetota bacterium]|nr:site-specific integrase [Actinomycetota bacterium]